MAKDNFTNDAPPAPGSGGIPDGFDLDIATGELVQTAPVDLSVANQVADARNAGQPAPGTTGTSNDPSRQVLPGQEPGAQAPSETLGDDRPIGTLVQEFEMPEAPVGATVSGFAGSVGGQGGGSEFEVSGKSIPDDPMARAMVTAGAAMQAAAQQDLFNKRGDALAAQANFYDDLQAEFGAFDEETKKQFTRLNDAEERKINEINQMVEQSRTRTVNPAAFYGNAGAGSAFAAAMATAVGSFTSARAGAGSNAAGDIINTAVERNIRAQELAIQQANFADQAEANLLQQIRATVHSRTQSRNVLRAMLLGQAQMEVQRMSAVAQREQIPGMKQQVLGQLQQQAGQAILDFHKERATEYKLKGKGLGGFNRALTAAKSIAAGQQAQQQQRSAGGGTRKPVKSTAETATENQARVAAERQQLSEILTTKFEGRTPREQSLNRAKAVRKAGLNELARHQQIQAEQGQYTDRQMKSIYDNSPLLKAAVRNWKQLMPIVDTVDISSGSRIYEFGLSAEGQALTAKDRVTAKKDRDTIGVDLDWLETAPRIRAKIEGGAWTALKRNIRLKPGGGFGLSMSDPGTSEAVKDVQVQMMQAINVLRSKYEGGALHGPGEFKIFEEMAAKMSTTESFLAWIGENGVDSITAAFDVLSNQVQKTLNGILTNRGYVTLGSQAHTLDDIMNLSGAAAAGGI